MEPVEPRFSASYNQQMTPGQERQLGELADLFLLARSTYHDQGGHFGWTGSPGSVGDDEYTLLAMVSAWPTWPPTHRRWPPPWSARRPSSSGAYLAPRLLGGDERHPLAGRPRLLLVLAFHGGAGGGELSQLVRSRAAIHVALTRLELAGMIRRERIWATAERPRSGCLYHLTEPGRRESVRLFHRGARAAGVV